MLQNNIPTWSPSSLDYTSGRPILRPEYSSTQPVLNNNWMALSYQPVRNSEYTNRLYTTDYKREVAPSMGSSDNGPINGVSQWKAVSIPTINYNTITPRTYHPRNSSLNNRTFHIPTISTDSAGIWGPINENNLNDTIENTERNYLTNDLNQRSTRQNDYIKMLSKNNREVTALMSGPI